MMKRCIAFLLTLMLLVSVMPAALAGNEPLSSGNAVEIRDVEGLRAISQNPGGAYALAADIDMDGVEWKPFAFSGKLDGRGHTIYNAKIIVCGDDSFTAIDGNRKEYRSVGVGLFSSLYNAEVKNLTILNGDVTVVADQDCFCALLAGYMENSLVENVKVSGRVTLTSYAVMVGVGGICGFGRGDFRSCEADVTLTHLDRLTYAHAEQFTGGLLATGYASAENCRVKIAGYTSCHGYVHDGGLIGMHFRYFDYDTGIHECKDNYTEGFITFFEENYDRRAYCDPFIGENLFGTLVLSSNAQSFERREVYDYSAELVPHRCENPEYTAVVTEGSCSGFGYTTYRCSACGYSYTDHFTPPQHGETRWEYTKEPTMDESGERVRICTSCNAVLESETIPPHVPGEWEVVEKPGYQTPGRSVLHCADCDAILDENELPALVQTERIDLNAKEIKLRFKSAETLTAQVFPVNADDTSYVWSSSNSDVATVTGEGLLYGRSAGDCVISCSAADGGAVAECTVHVRYSFGQQLIRIFLLGFLWYK